MNVRFVVFDAVGTVMFPTPGIAEIYQNALARHCGLKLPADRIRETVRTALRERSEADSLQTDEAAEHRFWRDLIGRLCEGHDGEQNCFDDLFRQFGQPDHWSCFDDVPACVAHLRKAGVGIAIASNFDRRLHSVLNGLPPLAEIEHRFVSSEIGWRKPAPSFFRHVLQELQADPAEVLFVGDDLQNDILGARQVDAPTAWIRRGPLDQEPVPEGTAQLSTLSELRPLTPGRTPL